MRLRPVFACLLLAACPPGEGTTAGSSTGDTDPSPTSGDMPTTTDAGTTATTGAMPDACVAGGIGPVFSWATPPPPGAASCLRITADSLALDCSGGFTGIFTLKLNNPGAPGLVVGETYEVDYRVLLGEDDSLDGEWLRVRGQNHWYIVAGQGPTLAPPNAPADWFHPNVEVSVASTDCAALVCDNGSGDEFTPRAISFGQGEFVTTLGPGQNGGVPGEFGGESYQAAVTEAQTGTCEHGEAGEAVDMLAYSIVTAGFR